MKVTEPQVPSLVIQVRKPRTGRVLWRGMASANLPAPANDARRK
jgi:hypothetical protein